MKRRDFVKDTAIAGLIFAMPDVLKAASHHAGNDGFLKIVPDPHQLAFEFFSIDSLGKNNLSQNIALKNEASGSMSFRSDAGNGKISYRSAGKSKEAIPDWEFASAGTSFTLKSNYSTAGRQSFVFNISQHANHATLLGIMQGDDKVLLPAVLHFPDMGTLRVTCTTPGQYLEYDSKRFIEHPFVRVRFPAATVASPVVKYHFEVVTIHPYVKGITRDARYDGFRRNFISIFQLNPFLGILSNNSSSDACAFTLYKYSEVALKTPPLADGLTALDLVRMTLDRYLAGRKGYGMLGYDYDKEWDIPESATTCNSLDSYPSLLIAACNYISGNKDKKWFLENEHHLQEWTDKMLSTDKNNNGLLKFCLSGNSGSWKGDKTMRPANWWDTIGFGHEDAYSNALAYRALVLLKEVQSLYGDITKAAILKARAEKLKAAYTQTFYNKATGILAGWKSADGELHDYYFTFVNGVAITYGLIDKELANTIMDKLLKKMKEVGFTNFELGMPGNLVPVKRADYTDLVLEAGGGKREDNLDGFQIYENGGATACFTYFTIRALQKLGRKKEADAILFPLLESLSKGNFQGRCENGRSRDWKTWDGTCWGYEGFLVDNYLFLLNVL